MIIAIILLIISFITEGLISNYISSSFYLTNLFSTLYTLICLVVIYPYFNNKKKYYILLIVFGILFDIVYTNTFLLNVFVFLVISLIIRVLNFILPENILITNVISIITIISYHILSYTILTIINYNSYPITLLFNICINSIIMTIIYTSLLYLISKFLFNKFDLKQIR